MPSESHEPSPFDHAERLLDPVVETLQDAGSEPEILYCLGIAPWADRGECVVAIGLTTPAGRAWVLTDRFEASWLILHRSGTAGQALAIPEHEPVDDLVAECCRFLGGLDRAPGRTGGKLS